MAEFDLIDESSVGQLVKSRVRNFEEDHPGCSVYAGDRRGMWDVRFTCGKGEARTGTAYVSAPDATGWVLRVHWPPGGKGAPLWPEAGPFPLPGNAPRRKERV